MNSEIIKDMDRLASSVEEAKRNVASLQGQESQLLQDLNSLGLKSLADAEKEITKLINQQNNIDTEIESKYQELKANYIW